MYKNELNKKIKSIKQINNEADRVLLMRQLTEEKKKVLPLHFLNFLLANRTSVKFGFVPSHNLDPLQNQKSHIFADAQVFFEFEKTQHTLNYKVK